MPKSQIISPVESRRPGQLEFAPIPINQYQKTCKEELASNRFSKADFLRIQRDINHQSRRESPPRPTRVRPHPDQPVPEDLQGRTRLQPVFQGGLPAHPARYKSSVPSRVAAPANSRSPPSRSTSTGRPARKNSPPSGFPRRTSCASSAIWRSSRSEERRVGKECRSRW